METKIVRRSNKSFTVEVTIEYSNSMLEFEDVIQEKVNEVGTISTGEALSRFDTDGSPILIGGKKWTSKGQIARPYQTPYGEVVVERHVYQSSSGGRIYCPLERDARIIITSTPRFAKILSSKYADFGSFRVVNDLEKNHGRKVAKSFAQNVCEVIGTVAIAKEEEWSYASPELTSRVETVSIGLDGTCMLMVEDGYRQTMVGTVGYYDKEGERLHTIYVSAPPEYGKSKFLSRLSNEISRAKDLYPDALYIGIADGAKDNWGYLESHTDEQVLDFWHVTSYLSRTSAVMFKGKKEVGAKDNWMDESCHNLKHKEGAADMLLEEIERYMRENKLSKDETKELKSVISYFKNNKHRMCYAQNVSNNLPIGSGVTEAACKVIVKQRLCNSGMKWKDKGASVVLSLRCLNYTKDRWEQFWDKINQYGFPVAA